MKKMIVAVGLVGFASLVGVEVGMAQVLTYHLEGLESFQVEARFGWSTDVIGLTEDAVRTRAELELGRNGITVSDNAPARLIVRIQTVPFRTDDVDFGIAYCVEVAVAGSSLRTGDVISFFVVRQDSMRYVITGEDLTQLLDKSSDATLWRIDSMGVVVHPNDGATIIMGAVSRALEVFRDDYLTANPR